MVIFLIREDYLKARDLYDKSKRLLRKDVQEEMEDLLEAIKEIAFKHKYGHKFDTTCKDDERIRQAKQYFNLIVPGIQEELKKDRDGKAMKRVIMKILENTVKREETEIKEIQETQEMQECLETVLFLLYKNPGWFYNED